MVDAKNRRTLFQRLKEEMGKDRAKHTILPPSKFGLVQITRQRVRPEMTIETLEKCPACDGNGKIKPSILVTDEIENNIKYLTQEQNEKQLKLEVHPFVHAYLTKGVLTSIRSKWQRKYGRKIALEKNNNLHFLEYHFYDKNGEELKI